MAQSLKEQMKAEQISEVDNNLRKIASEHHLRFDQFILKENHAFIDGQAFLGENRIDVSSLCKQFFEIASNINLIVSLPITAEFEKEGDVIRQVTAQGGSIARPLNGDDFEQFVTNYLEDVNFVPSQPEPKIIANAGGRIDAKTFLAPYYYTLEERRKLRQAYAEEEDSSSIAS